MFELFIEKIRNMHLTTKYVKDMPYYEIEIIKEDLNINDAQFELYRQMFLELKPKERTKILRENGYGEKNI